MYNASNIHLGAVYKPTEWLALLRPAGVGYWLLSHPPRGHLDQVLVQQMWYVVCGSMNYHSPHPTMAHHSAGGRPSVGYPTFTL